MGVIFVVMIFASWNVKGLGRPAKRATVRRLIRLHKVNLLCLQETKIHCLQETKIHKGVDSVVFDIWGSRKCASERGLSKGAIGWYYIHLGGEYS